MKFETFKQKLVNAGLQVRELTLVNVYEYGDRIPALMVDHDYEGPYLSDDARLAYHTAAILSMKYGFRFEQRGHYTGTMIYSR